MVYAIIIHGGASGLTEDDFKLLEPYYPGLRQKYIDSLTKYANIGLLMLKENKPLDDIVTKCISLLEDDELFNSGKGSVYDINNKYYMDASIMSGVDMSYGCVTNVSNIKNPIQLANVIRKKYKRFYCSSNSKHTNLAKEHELEIVPNSYYQSHFRDDIINIIKKQKYSTVGCVVYRNGNIVAGTSTGGMLDKMDGRVSDSSVIGAGTFADKFCGVSCTGIGEYFMQHVIAHDIASKIKYKNITGQEAAKEYMDNCTEQFGGFIGIDKDMNIFSVYNSTALYHAYGSSKEEVVTRLN
jgi:L-asparaginase / beta-aspartyl-peptidase